MLGTRSPADEIEKNLLDNSKFQMSGIHHFM
jgi:hypothetical protein